jgi:hypothetical protein
MDTAGNISKRGGLFATERSGTRAGAVTQASERSMHTGTHAADGSGCSPSTFSVWPSGPRDCTYSPDCVILATPDHGMEIRGSACPIFPGGSWVDQSSLYS